jgi:hypothetical protein
MVALKIFPVHAWHSASLCKRLQAMKELSCDCEGAEIGPRHWKITRPASPARLKGAEEAMPCTREKAVAGERSDSFSWLTDSLLWCRDAESPAAAG